VSKKIAVGIDIGTHQIKVVVSELLKEKNKTIPRVIGRGLSESKGLRFGYIVNQNDVTKSLEIALNQAERSAGVKIKKADVSIGGIGLESVVAEGSAIGSKGNFEMSELDIQKVQEVAENNIELLNKKIIHTIPIQFKIDGQKVLGRPIGIKGKKLEGKFLFITYLKQHLEDLAQAIEKTGIEIGEFVAAPIASSIVTLTKAQKIAGCVLANLGAETVSIIVYENGDPISLETFPIGSTNITNDIALGLKIPLEEAEKIKIGMVSGTSYSKKKLEEIISARLEDIFELIDNHLKKIGRNGLLPAGIILTGGGSGITTIEDLARAYLALPSKIATINFISNANSKIKDSTWSVAYGLCILGLTKKEDSKGIETFKRFKNKILNLLKQLSV